MNVNKNETIEMEEKEVKAQMGVKRRAAFGLTFGIIAVVAGLWSLSITASHMQSHGANISQNACDQKLKILDQAAVALDHGQSTKADELQLQADNITGC